MSRTMDGYSVFQRNNFGRFIQAIRNEDLQEVTTLFNTDFVTRKVIGGGLSPLHVAVMNNNDGRIVEFLLSVGFNIEDEETESGYRSIHYAVVHDKLEILKMLIKCGCILDSITKEKDNALDIALQFNKSEFVDVLRKANDRVKEDQELLEKNSLSKIIDPKTGETLLDRLLNNKDPRILEAIMSKPVTNKEVQDWKSLVSSRNYPDSCKLIQECLLLKAFLQRKPMMIRVLWTPDMYHKQSLFTGPSTIQIINECDYSKWFLSEFHEQSLSQNQTNSLPVTCSIPQEESEPQSTMLIDHTLPSSDDGI